MVRKANEGVIFADGRVDEDIVGRWFSDCFASHSAGKIGFHRWSQIYKNASERATQLQNEEQGAEEEGKESIESHVARIRALVADTVRGETKVENEGNAMWGVLGYRIKEMGDEELDRETRTIHEQRMRDILGVEVLRVKELCEEGILGAGIE